MQLCHICTVCSTVNVVATLALSVLPLLQATAIIVHDKSGKVRAALFAGKDLRRIETAPTCRLTRRLDCSVPVLMSSALSGKDTGTQAPYGKPYQICVPSIGYLKHTSQSKIESSYELLRNGHRVTDNTRKV